ncbi:MAG: 4'-phosphopantetheinyl transferase superfamily protein [Pseudomonadota bacterium]
MIDPGAFEVVHTGDRVRVHAVELGPDRAADEAACFALLDSEERVRAKRFRVEAPRRRFIITRGSLRVLLGAHLDVRPERLSFAAGEHGKPSLVVDGRSLKVGFNVSHTEDRGLIAIGEGAVGVDIEFLGREADFDGVARVVFTTVEQAALQATDGQDRVALFYRLWTQKEALIKARGSGFAYPPRDFSVPETMLDGARDACFTFPGERAPVWRLLDLTGGRYAAALVETVTGPSAISP